MDFANFWLRDITLALAATSCPLDLPDGQYRLTLSDSATEPRTWEIIEAVVVAGAAELTRALEGTEQQDWPAGSVIYCAVTAGTLEALSQNAGGLSGDGLPAAPPTAGGMTYVDRVAPALFVAQGTASLDDWRQVGGAPYTQYLTFDASETPVPIERWARDITAECEVEAFEGLAVFELPSLGGGLGALEKMAIRIYSPDGPGYQLQLDYTAMAARLGLTGIFIETNLPAPAPPGGGRATFDLTGNHLLSISAGLSLDEGETRWGLLRVEVSELVDLNSISGPV